MAPEKTNHFDLVIIGAGPAGAAAAKTARRKGLSVALIDKAKFPRDKLCGGLFTGRSRGAFQQIFGRDINPDLFERRHRISFFIDGEALGPVVEFPPVHLTMRRDMDDELLNHALEAGAENYTARRIEVLDLQVGKVTLSGLETLTFDILIGADGVNSMVAKTLFGQAFNPKNIGFALEIEAGPIPGAGEQSDLRIDFDAASWGYGWHFPKAGSTTIGLGGVHRSNPDMKARLAAYLDLLGEGQKARVKGHFLPFGAIKQKPGKGNILLVGDAAGFVDPITGEGIAYALLSGHQAALAAAIAITAKSPGNACGLYKKSIAPLQRSIHTARILRLVIFTKVLRPFFKKTFSRSRTLKQEYLRMLSGETEYRDIMRLFIRRLPGALWRGVKR